MQDTVQNAPATFTGHEAVLNQAPATDPRTITYPLKSGGSITTPCPAWCTTDHTDDVVRGINPADLLHQGDAVSLDYAPDGVNVGILQGRIQQWPFDDNIEAAPHIEFTPDVNTGVSLYFCNRLELDDEIRRVRAHLHALIELGDQLSEAQAVDHETRYGGIAGPWAAVSRTDLQTLPVAYLLRVFGVTVVETEYIGRQALLALHGAPGAMELRVKRDVPQHLRENETRRALLAWFDSKSQADEAPRRVRGEAV